MNIERGFDIEQMPKEIDKLDAQLFSNYSPQQALAFAKTFSVVDEGDSDYDEKVKEYADWVEDLRTGWYQQRKEIKLCNDAST
jgi:hypothetical protein